jgi:hypothetical protein
MASAAAVNMSISGFVKLTSAAARFSSNRCSFVVPGMGMILEGAVNFRRIDMINAKIDCLVD